MTTIEDWLLTEAVRLHEERRGRRRDDAAALAAARAGDDDLAARVVMRARALPGAGGIRADIRRLFGLVRSLVLLLLAVGVVAGAASAAGGMADRSAEFLLVAGTLLGLPTLMLLLWLLLMLPGMNRGTHAGSLVGGALAAGLRRLGPGFLHGDHAAEITVAAGRLLHTRFGRWLLSAVTHAFWCACLGAVLVTLTLLFSFARYELTWGTTLLAPETVAAMVEGLSRLPVGMGLLPAPESGWIPAGGADHPAAADRAQWARLLLALVAVYGLLPRLLLLVLSLALAYRALRRLRIDPSLPAYQRLAGALATAAPVVARADVAEPDARSRRRRSPKAAGDPVCIGIELDTGTDLPTIADLRTRSLGRADDRSGRRQVLAALEALRAPPPALLVACSLARTPDAGAERFINRAADAADAVPVLVLVEGDRLPGDGERLAARRADWEALAERTGGEAAALDRLQSAGPERERLLQLLRGERP